MSRRALHDLPPSADLLDQMEEHLGLLENLATVVTLIFHAGTAQGELTSIQCHGGMCIADQIEGVLTKAVETHKAIQARWPAAGRGGVV